ncbi:unnamed protein product [Notodromas monacha]|uniref:Uncharacterized protein n=1 Tax=Notodromas monacha TaxID=399045 RepID=A0A7R9C023_9CRUS|nr:unnamed protein product [Notodromas monacha]CAG0923719.1 unnamed protein product [Notodromas monacha]
MNKRKVAIRESAAAVVVAAAAAPISGAPFLGSYRGQAASGLILLAAGSVSSEVAEDLYFLHKKAWMDLVPKTEESCSSERCQRLSPELHGHQIISKKRE